MPNPILGVCMCCKNDKMHFTKTVTPSILAMLRTRIATLDSEWLYCDVCINWAKGQILEIVDQNNRIRQRSSNAPSNSPQANSADQPGPSQANPVARPSLAATDYSPISDTSNSCSLPSPFAASMEDVMNMPIVNMPLINLVAAAPNNIAAQRLAGDPPSPVLNPHLAPFLLPYGQPPSPAQLDPLELNQVLLPPVHSPPVHQPVEEENPWDADLEEVQPYEPMDEPE